MKKILLFAIALILLSSCAKQSDCGYCIYTNYNGDNAVDELCGKDYMKCKKDVKKFEKKGYTTETKYIRYRDV